ncbi:FGGY-family carbohydrate kinase [Bartonella sp. HY329]|uniref:FGGY-family carbohydrate kinase n=1 Tax=unclassified Bartonella TaxID=2645622 RepID=UPI0021C98AD0|nr:MULTISPECIES: FGGY-family carbohydrate kinase [unclassified Bartonella]UXM94906.1 FGGY-family carbohydrate kinase [Bartonella sp. HY329]UXN09229.1 FGGY-family carbohydrate kinase [Bartonella sp. HY328]
MHENTKFVIGIDVGTGSARAGIFDCQGSLLASAKRPIQIFYEEGHIVEQSSNDIWSAVCASIREAVEVSGIQPENIVGIGFDATCSLVVLGENGQPLAVGPSNDPERNIIVWMDHRAMEQAERINAGHHFVLRYVGGQISPEMETPKLLWLKENRRHIFDQASSFFDLADYLTWRATGDMTRSTCTLTCKWTYLAHEKRWDSDYFYKIGLGELVDEGFTRIGADVANPGQASGNGLTELAAKDMGLIKGTAVAIGMIDAHAGGIGSVGVGAGATHNMAYVFGTSSCTMTSTIEPVFVAGVWGPYFSAMVPNLWLNEGGQSAAGAAIDQLLSWHPFSPQASLTAKQQNLSLPVFLANKAIEKAGSASKAVLLAKGYHIVPEFLGNRAPFANPHTRAVIAGLGMEADLDSLIALYVAGLCGIAYGLRQIIDAQAQSGVDVENIVISGGAGQHELVRQILADACNRKVIATNAEEPVLLGSAILAAVASGLAATVEDAMHAMSSVGGEYQPYSSEITQLHDKRYDAFKQLQTIARNLNGI